MLHNLIISKSYVNISINFYQRSIKIDQFYKDSYYGLGKSLSSMDKWFEANDASVTEVKPEVIEIERKQAYIYLYCETD